MFLGRVVRIRRRVVAPEQTLFRPAVVVRRYGWERGVLSAIDVLVSRSVPPERRPDVAEAMIRAFSRQACANEGGAYRVRWEGERAPVAPDGVTAKR